MAEDPPGQGGAGSQGTQAGCMGTGSRLGMLRFREPMNLRQFPKLCFHALPSPPTTCAEIVPYGPGTAVPSEVPATAQGGPRSPWTGPQLSLGATAVDRLSHELTTSQCPRPQALGGTSPICLDLSVVFGSSSKLQEQEGWGTQDASSFLP